MTKSTPVIVPEQIVLAGTAFYFKFRDLLPPLSWAEQASQREHMARHGIKVPVLLVERADGDFDVIDGINRLMNAMQLQIPLDDIPRDVHILTEDEQEDLALSLNFERRQLTGKQREAIVVRLHERGKSQRAIADKIGSSATTVNRVLKAAGVSSETPEDATVTGKDGKQYPAVTEKTRVQQLADEIMAVFHDRKTGALHVDEIKRYGPQVSEELFIKAINFLGADKRLTTIGGGQYRRIFDNGPDLDHWCGAAPQIEAAILITLQEFGPKKFHAISQYLNSNWGQTAPHAFDAALNHLLDDGTVIRQAEDQHTLALAPIDHIDPVTAEVTQAATHVANMQTEGPAAPKFDPQEIARIADTLPDRQREFLLAVAMEQPVARIAPIRIALINRKLLQSGDRVDWWETINMTELGLAVAALLIEEAETTTGEDGTEEISPLPACGEGPGVGSAQPSGAWKECAADIARYLGADGPATRKTIREALGRPYESATITQAFKFLLVRRYIREDPKGLAITNDGRTVYLRDQGSPLPASDQDMGEGSPASESAAPPPGEPGGPTRTFPPVHLINGDLVVEGDDTPTPHTPSLNAAGRAALIDHDNAAHKAREGQNTSYVLTYQHFNDTILALQALRQAAAEVDRLTRSIKAWPELLQAHHLSDARTATERAVAVIDDLATTILPDFDATLRDAQLQQQAQLEPEAAS